MERHRAMLVSLRFTFNEPPTDFRGRPADAHPTPVHGYIFPSERNCLAPSEPRPSREANQITGSRLTALAGGCQVLDLIGCEKSLTAWLSRGVVTSTAGFRPTSPSSTARPKIEARSDLGLTEDRGEKRPRLLNPRRRQTLLDHLGDPDPNICPGYLRERLTTQCWQDSRSEQ